MKKHCVSCNREIPQTSSHCVFCGKRQPYTPNPSTSSPVVDPKATYRGSAPAEEDPATIRRPPLAAFTATRSPGESQHLPAFQLAETTTEDLPPPEEPPHGTLLGVKAVKPPAYRFQEEASSLPAGFETLPLTPAALRPSAPQEEAPQDNPETHRFLDVGQKILSSPTLSSQSSSAPPTSSARETLLGMAPPLPPGAAARKKTSPPIQIKEEASSAFETMIGMAPVRSSAYAQANNLPSPPIPVQKASLPSPKDQPPEKEEAAPAFQKEDTNADDIEGSSTLPGARSALDLMEKTIRPPEDDPEPAPPYPAPPGKVVARMTPSSRKGTDLSPPAPESAQPLPAGQGQQAAPLPPRPTVLETAVPSGKPTLLAEGLLAPTVKSPAEERPPSEKSGPHVEISDSLQASIEEVHQGVEPPSLEKKEDPPAVKSPHAAIPLDAPVQPGQGAGTAQLVKSARDALPESTEPVLPGQNLARVFGIFGGVLLLGAVLLPVGFSPFVPSWGLFGVGSEAFLLMAWAVAGVAGIGGGVAPLLPRWRGLVLAGAALPALVMGAFFGLPLLIQLLGPSLGLGAGQGTPTSEPAALEVGALPILASVVPVWRVGFAILAWVLLPAGLFYRRFDTASMPARLVVTAGIAVVLANYLIPLDGGFVATLLSPVIGGSESTAALLNANQVSPFSLVLHLLGQTDELLLFFGVLLVLPAAFALLSFSAFFPGEQISRDTGGALRISTPVLYTGLSGVWVAFYLLYLPIPLIALGLFLLTDPAQQTSGLALIRFGLVGGALPLIFALGCGQMLASLTYRKDIE